MNKPMDIVQQGIETTYEPLPSSTHEPKDTLTEESNAFSLIALNNATWDNADTIQKKTYEEAISSALALETVYDIAISGPYGSGKSFVISTFFNREKYIKETIYISLGTFQITKIEKGKLITPTQNDEFILEDEGDRQEIEQTILQQLIYHVTPETTPASRILRISKTPDERKKRNIKEVSISLLCLVILLKPSFFNYPNYEQFEIFYFIIQLIALGVLIYHVGRAIIDLFGSIKNIKISKLGTDLAEVVLDEKKSSSIFNRYLDEILHFFECTQYQYVVIEDLDRFNDVEIFTRLRSLNKAINNYPSIKGGAQQNRRRIRFIYAVKDDLFIKDHRDRTKFFDVIIPVIPVISYSNSEEKIKKLLIEKGIHDELSEDLIWQVSAFINDMRQVKNIINEYGIYRRLLEHIPNKNRLFALIVYKNLDPCDFSLFHHNQGYLYTVQKLRPILIDVLQDSLEKDRVELNAALEEAELELVTNTDDLKRIYISKALAELDINDGSLTQEYHREVVVEKFINLQNFDTFFLSQVAFLNKKRTQFISTHVNQMDKRDGKPNQYNQRIKQIEDRVKIHDLRKKIELNESEKRNIGGFSIQRLLKAVRYNSGSLEKTLANHDYNDEEKLVVREYDSASQLLKFLVIQGHLDDSTSSYVAYFHSDGMSSDDVLFLQNLFSGGNGNKPPSLKNPEYLLRKLNVDHFENEFILDPKLIALLIKEREKYPEKLDRVIQLIKSDKKHLWLVDGYNDDESLEPLVIELANQSDTFFDDINDKPDDALASFIKTIIYKVDIRRASALNSSGKLEHRISTLAKLDEIVNNDNLEPFKLVVEALNIRFENLTDLKTLEKGVGRLIYNGNHYVLNPQMIGQIIAASNVTSKEINLKRCRVANYTLINDLNLSKLIAYIGTKPETYLTNVMLALPENTEESEESILFFVNKPEVTEVIKLKLLAKQKALISKLADVGDDFLPIVINSLKFEVNWENLLYYFNLKEADEHVVNLFNTSEIINLDMFKSTGLSTQEEWQQLDQLLVSILVKENLKKETFERLASILPNPSRAIDVIKGIDDLKRKEYIIKKISIPINGDNIQAMEAVGSSTFILFLHKYQKEIKELGLINSSWEELISKSDGLDDKLRESLIYELFHIPDEDDGTGADTNDSV